MTLIVSLWVNKEKTHFLLSFINWLSQSIVTFFDNFRQCQSGSTSRLQFLQRLHLLIYAQNWGEWFQNPMATKSHTGFKCNFITIKFSHGNCRFFLVKFPEFCHEFIFLILKKWHRKITTLPGLCLLSKTFRVGIRNRKAVFYNPVAIN